LPQSVSLTADYVHKSPSHKPNLVKIHSLGTSGKIDETSLYSLFLIGLCLHACHQNEAKHCEQETWQNKHFM